MSQQLKYRIYPSLLDKFNRLLNAEEEYESSYNRSVDEDGIETYKKSFDEIHNELEQSLIDSINRVDHEPIEAADRGTAFNEIVDCLVHNRKPTREDVILKSMHEQDINGNKRLVYINAEINGFTFQFDGELCTKAAEYFKGCSSQYQCSATLPTIYGNVELYGYLDELRADIVYDIKTTSRYDFGKFAEGWQKHVYPYCLIESGMVTEISEFEYTVFVLKDTTRERPYIVGDMYRERYDYDHEKSKHVLTDFVSMFIEWLEDHRDNITDKKIFNEL